MEKTVPRIAALDILRGAIMLLMVVDHVRVYSGIPAWGTDPAIFFTRWVTHFCAPGFAFFAGTSAYLYRQKVNSSGALSKFLFVRGLILVIMELTVIRFFWSFNPDITEFVLAGVIWMLGWSMIILGMLTRLRTSLILIIGIAMIAFQQVFQHVPSLLPQSARESFGKIWAFFYFTDYEPAGGINVLYVLLPWVGVMMVGYSFGALLLKETRVRNKACLWIGTIAILLFLGFGVAFSLNQKNNEMPLLLQLLNQKKYPPSQLFLFMTLGPLIILIPIVEKARGWPARVLSVFGKVPMFFYLLHILIIHLLALLVNLVRTGKTGLGWYMTAPYSQIPNEMHWSLPLLYLIVLVATCILYFSCRWYAAYKTKHPGNQIMKYI